METDWLKLFHPVHNIALGIVMTVCLSTLLMYVVVMHAIAVFIIHDFSPIQACTVTRSTWHIAVLYEILPKEGRVRQSVKRWLIFANTLTINNT